MTAAPSPPVPAPDRHADFDVLVIGAGISGLTAAALLAGAGRRVCVVEKQPVPGGYLQGFSRHGFTFDTAIHWLNGLQHDGLVRRVLDRLGGDWPRAVPLQRILRLRGDSYDYLLTDNPDQLRDRLAQDFPREAAGVRRLFADSRRLGAQLRLLQYRMRSAETMDFPGKVRFGCRMTRWYLPVRRFLAPDAASGLAHYFRGEYLSRVFCAEERLSSVMVPIAWSYDRDFFAAPPGGAQTWIAWLAQRLRDAGGDLRLSREVTRVIIENGRAGGVELADGQTIRARWVVAACDVERLYTRLLPPGTVSHGLRRRLSRADLYYSCVMLFCGLSCPAQELGLGEEMVRLTRDGLPRRAYRDGDPATAAILILAPSVRDPSLAPPGKGTLTIQCPAWFDQYDRWGTGPNLTRGENYRACKQAYADALLERVEHQFLPGLRRRLEFCEAATPITFQRYTGNRDGSIMGHRPTAHNIRSRLARHRTPLPGLLLAGHWSEHGGGVPLAIKAAANASLLVLRHEDDAAFRSLCAVMDGAKS